ncbi:MAG TPA: hypothetical protein VNB24_10625 [Acidimicrobiales bacterium]|nr:hypothetical protein [Acidimicrobiales bacterium]
MRKLLLAVGFIAAGLTASDAVAQTTTAPPYPGSPTTTIGPGTSAFQDLGAKPVPSTFDISFCQFIGQTESTVDESQGDTQQAGINNCVTKSVELTFAGTALGTNRPLAATNFAQSVRQVRIRVNGRLYPTKPLGFTHTITVRGTGTNGASRTVTAVFRTVPAGSTTTRSGLARTGTFALQWAPLGVGLVGLGYLLVLATRRRRTA